MTTVVRRESAVREESVVAEPKNPLQLKLRDWPQFQNVGTKRQNAHSRSMLDGRPIPRISELLMSELPGTPTQKLQWLMQQKSTGKLDGDDPDEIAEAEALLAMLV